MCRDYYVLQFIDRSVDTAPIAPALAAFFDDVLDQSISQLNFKVSAHSWRPSHTPLPLPLQSSSTRLVSYSASLV